MRGRGREDDRGREASFFLLLAKKRSRALFPGDEDEMEGFAPLCRLAELGFCVFGFLLFFLEVGDEDWFGLGFLQTQKKGS
jgi:hypothetical protein